MNRSNEIEKTVAELKIDIWKELIESLGYEMPETDIELEYNDKYDGEVYGEDHANIIDGMMIYHDQAQQSPDKISQFELNTPNFHPMPMVAPYVSPDGKWNMQRSISWIQQASATKSSGRCAKFVRMALEQGGISTIGRPVAAKDYVAFLPSKGFKNVATLVGRNSQSAFSAQPGDIAVMAHGMYGHICMWTGSQWVSDFKQNNMWPYSGDGTVKIFRYNA